MTDHGADVFDVDGEATLFGFDATRVRARLRPRSRGWRVGGAAATMAVSLVVAPVIAVLPPHAIWFVAAVGGGGFLARRRYIERFCLESLEGACPRCGADLSVKRGRLRTPHPVPCDACRHDANVRFPPEALARIAADG